MKRGTRDKTRDYVSTAQTVLHGLRCPRRRWHARSIAQMAALGRYAPIRVRESVVADPLGGIDVIWRAVFRNAVPNFRVKVDRG